MANLTYGWTQSEHFLQNQGTFFDLQKRAGEASPPSCAPEIRQTSKQSLT